MDDVVEGARFGGHSLGVFAWLRSREIGHDLCIWFIAMLGRLDSDRRSDEWGAKVGISSAKDWRISSVTVIHLMYTLG